MASPTQELSGNTPTLELKEIQGMVVSGYAQLTQTRYLFLHIDDPGATKHWLKDQLQYHHITFAARTRDPLTGQPISPPQAINLAFTYSGLKSLGAPKELLQSFPPEFIEGMQAPHRAQQLGDLGINAPEHWEELWQRTTPSVDLLLVLQAKPKTIEALYQQYQDQLAAAGCQLLAVESGYLPLDSREHFGFHDSISQPFIEGSPQAKRFGALSSPQDLIKAGEFILGYLNEDGNYPSTATVPMRQDPQHCLPLVPETSFKDFGKNGSYLVFRKLEQDVVGFRQYLNQFNSPEMQQRTAAKMVGRWPSGAPLTLAPDQDPHWDENPDNDWLGDSNRFSYRAEDPDGFRCPLGAHIRRMNPRDSLGSDPEESFISSRRRRLLRRGSIYGERLPEGVPSSDNQPRGLLFFCINANIRRQFEFVQQTWINNPTFHGRYNERDPIIGYNPDGSERTMTIPQTPLCQHLNLPNFVTLKGGAYFFLPSLSALNFLAV
jgi:Dyp-type peroxidase family